MNASLFTILSTLRPCSHLPTSFQKVPNNRMQEWNAHRDGAGENIFILTSFQKEEERERDKEHMINEREENSVGSHSLLNPAQVVVDLGIDTKLASRCTACTPGDNALDLSIADDRGTRVTLVRKKRPLPYAYADVREWTPRWFFFIMGLTQLVLTPWKAMKTPCISNYSFYILAHHFSITSTFIIGI